MSDVIDELKVQIDASTKSADAKLDKFIDKMLQLQSAITSVKMSNATNISNGLNQITSSVQNFNKNTKTADFTRIATGLNKLSAVDSGAISAVSRSMADFVSSMTGIERVHFDSQSFDTLAGSVAKLGRASITEAAQNLEFLKTSLSEFVTSMNAVGQVSFNADGLVSVVNSVSRLGSANAAQAVALLPQISAHLRDFVLTMNSVGSVTFDFTGLGNLISGITRLGGTKATQASANLKPIKDQLLKFVSGLNGIGKLSFDTTSLAELVSSITKLGGKAAGNAIPNIQNLGAALNQLMTTLAKAPVVSQNLIQMTTALANLAGAGSKVGSATSAMNQGFNLFSGSSKKVKTSSKGIASAIGRVYATYWMLFRAMGMFRKAMDISSDLTEVQNVVDVTFGNMKKTMEDFAKVSLSQYGMSALTAKDIASRYQAMGVAMGFSQKKMSGMSIELTKLAADMASFYNVDQKEVAKSLEAVFTGQTMPLRKYGIDLTQATLKQWALNNGLNANIKSMSAAEKMWLRYQYVMANSQQVMGDFARTSDSWHNQLVLLSGAFQTLGAIVGGSLINAFKPFIRALNSVMLKVIQFAEVVSNALGAIFGWKYESGSGISDDFSDAADSADDLAGSTGDAAKNTKKMADNLQSFDKLNVISSQNDSGGSGGGGGGAAGGAGTAASGGQWVEADSLWEKYTSSIDSLYKLGEYIGDVLTKTLKGIDWDKIYRGADQFGIGLANFLNGLISPELFEAVGETVAGALNTALHFLDSFGETFEWTEFGNSIAAGINGFFNTFDFLLLADTLNVWAHGLLDTLITFLDKTEWDTIGTKIGEFLGELDLLGVGAKVGEALWKAINAGITVWKGAFDAAPVETAIITAIGLLEFTPLGGILAGKITTSIKNALKNAGIGGLITGAFKSAVTAAIGEIGYIFEGLGAVISNVASGIMTPFEAMGSQFGFLGTIASAVAGIGSVIGGTVMAVSNFFKMWEDGFNATNGLFMGFGAALTAVGAIILGAPALVAAGIAGVVTALATAALTIHDNWDSVVEFFQSIPDTLKAVWDNVTTAATEAWGAFVDYVGSIPEKVGNTITSIGEFFSQLPEKIGYALGYALGRIVAWEVNMATTLKEKVPEIIENVRTWFSELPEKIWTAISGAIETVTTWGKNVYDSFSKAVDEAIQAVVKWFSEMPGKIYDEIIKIEGQIQIWATNTISFFQTEVPKICDKVIEFFGQIPKDIVQVGENVVKGLWNGINNMVSWLGTNINGFVNGVIDGFKAGFDEHSPSKIAFQIGDFFTIGLWNGMEDKFANVYASVSDFTDKISSVDMTPSFVDPTVKINRDFMDTVNTQQSFSYTPANIDLSSDVTAVISSALSGVIDYNKLGEAVYRAQSRAMQENPTTIGDDDVFNAARRAQRKYYKRTNNPGFAF